MGLLEMFGAWRNTVMSEGERKMLSVYLKGFVELFGGKGGIFDIE
jgi:hypothetical protein